MSGAVNNGLKAFPLCKACQCYPECRTDCPDHLECAKRLPEYSARKMPSDMEAKFNADMDKVFGTAKALKSSLSDEEFRKLYLQQPLVSGFDLAAESTDKAVAWCVAISRECSTPHACALNGFCKYKAEP